jgi:hypothetical protein
MFLVENELDNLGGQTGICEQCGNTMYGRHVTGGVSQFGGASRGTFFLCFDCCKPMIRWKKSKTGITFETPCGHEQYIIRLRKIGGRPNTASSPTAPCASAGGDACNTQARRLTQTVRPQRRQ